MIFFLYISSPICVSGQLCALSLYKSSYAMLYSRQFSNCINNLAITALKITQKLFAFCDSFYSPRPVRSQTASSARRVWRSVVDFTASPVRLRVPHAPCATAASTLTTSVFRLPERRPGFGYGKKKAYDTQQKLMPM